MSMIVTPWRTFIEGDETYRIQVKYGLDRDFAGQHNQEPYFSITCAIARKARNGRWLEGGGGAAHDDIARHFPELARYIKWHLVGTDGPMHYLANARYWWEIYTGTSKWASRPGDPDPLKAFKNIIIHGAINGERVPERHRSWTGDVEVELQERLPDLMDLWTRDMETLGVVE